MYLAQLWIIYSAQPGFPTCYYSNVVLVWNAVQEACWGEKMAVVCAVSRYDHPGINLNCAHKADPSLTGQLSPPLTSWTMPACLSVFPASLPVSLAYLLSCFPCLHGIPNYTSVCQLTQSAYLHLHAACRVKPLSPYHSSLHVFCRASLQACLCSWHVKPAIVAYHLCPSHFPAISAYSNISSNISPFLHTHLSLLFPSLASTSTNQACCQVAST